MAYARSCMHAYNHVAPLQTFIISGGVVLASMLVAVALAAEPPSGYRFELTHVDAQGNFTKDELIRRAADRSRLRGQRAATTSAALLGANKPSHGASTSYRSKVHFSEDEYLMEVKIQDQKYQAIVDTGSSLIWMKPRKQNMSPRHPLPCDDDLCPRCDPSAGCSYDEEYGDGLHTSGTMCLETLSFRRPWPQIEYTPVDDIALGWSKETNCPKKIPQCDLKKYDGVVGLGLGKRSLVKQLQSRGVDTFSYCLTNYDNNKLKSPLLLGSLAAIKDSSTIRGNRGKVQTTPLLQNTDHPSRYYVHLERIEIGGTPTYLPTPKPKEDATTGSSEVKETPNMFIDSGTSFTVLEETALEALRKHVNKAMKKKEEKIDSTFCWIGTTLLPKMPDLELHFTGGAVMYLHRDKIMYVDRGRQQVCLAIEVDPKLPAGVSILGNFQQQNIHMHFDVAKNQVSFVEVDDCAKI